MEDDDIWGSWKKYVEAAVKLGDLKMLEVVIFIGREQLSSYKVEARMENLKNK